MVPGPVICMCVSKPQFLPKMETQIQITGCNADYMTQKLALQSAFVIPSNDGNTNPDYKVQ